MRGVAILGSTGSIGKSALAVLERQRDTFRVVALTAMSNGDALARQTAVHAPQLSGLVSQRGPELLIEAATHPDADIVLNAVVGAAGLDATLAALRAGKRVALANKETLVMAGDLVRAAAREGGAAMLIFYGLALFNTSKYTLDEIRYLGILEICLGLIASLWTHYGLLFWGIGFGVLHIIYGSLMYFKYEK